MGVPRPAFTRGAVGSKCNLIVLDAGDVFDDAFAVKCPRVDAESEGSFFSVSFGLRERGQVEFGVLQNRKPDLPAHGCRIGLLEHQLPNLLPMRTELTLLAYRGHIFARFQDCAQRAAIFRRDGWGQLFREIRRMQHGLKARAAGRALLSAK